MAKSRRPAAFWFIFVFLAVSIILMLAGQTLGVFNYELAARLGLQEKPEEMTEFGVEVNRAFGAADTFRDRPVAQETVVARDDGGILRRFCLLDGDRELHIYVPSRGSRLCQRSGPGDLALHRCLHGCRGCRSFVPGGAR